MFDNNNNNITVVSGYDPLVWTKTFVEGMDFTKITASYCSTYSCSFYITGSYKVDPPPPAPPSKDAGVRPFFEKLGYKIMMDWSFSEGEEWWEIYGEDGIICQIDTGVPIEDIVEDIVRFYQDKNGTSKSDYKINASPSAALTKLYKDVYNFSVYGAMPDGQLLLPL